jgi:PucR family transcriptional regulator, purine catabolism regulatory protein
MLGGTSAHTWEEQSAQSLLTDLVSGVVPARQLLPRARAAGLPVNRRTFVPLVVHDGEPARLERVLRLLGLPGLVAELTDGATAVLLSLARDQDAAVLVANFAARMRSEDGRLTVAAADPRTAWDDVPVGLREAQHVADAVADSSAALDLPCVVRLKDVHLRGLIRLLRDDPQVQSFAERELDGLLRPDGDDLLSVLRTYLATGRNKSRTAQLHHVSRPALYRRLEAIQSRLGVDLDDFEQAASVHIALLAHDAQQG